MTFRDSHCNIESQSKLPLGAPSIPRTNRASAGGSWSCECRIRLCMCDDDEDRAAGTTEVTRGGDGSWGTGRYQSCSQDAASEELGRRKISQCRIPRSPRIGSGRLVGPMTGHDGLTARVAGTLTSRSRPLLTTLTTLLVALSCCCARASEFPERECCDLPYPIPEPTGRSTSAPTPTGRSGKSSRGIVKLI